MSTQTTIDQKPKNMRQLKPYLKTVDKINAIETDFQNLTDTELQEKTDEFKTRLDNGETIHDLTAEAFATVRETARRILGMRHFDVQLLGGLVLLNGNISEMKTGEGKTLVASLPSYLVALEGKGMHVITVNDYLAQRDMELIGQIHQFLGLRVGLNLAGISNAEKKEAYNCDITYGVGTEFGFDYLRDNMVQSPGQKVQRPYHFAIIDEVDNVLIDEAKTPLIIAGKDQPSGGLYKVCAKVVKNFQEDTDYVLDPEMKVVNFTEDGISTCEKIFGINNLFDLEHSTLFHSLLQALRARILFERDVDYIVEDGEIKLIDMNTGRVMEGRSLSDGLHQAIESKEGLVNTEENKTHASITIQNYFRMYPALSGMTGTAKTEEEEIQKIYGMDVFPVPPNKPNQRIDLPDLVYKTKQQKEESILQDIKTRHAKEQPILIGTTSIMQSEEIATLLDRANLNHQLLNAKNIEKEASMIAMAGQRGNITIATNMAGRGTDIMLGEDVDKLGGLHVLGTQRNESQRIDNQLKGRSARQGDPGSTQFIISLEDYLFTRYAPTELERITPKVKADENGLIQSQSVHKFVDTAQKICEGINYQIREHNLKMEGVLNSQREVIYQFRDNILDETEMLPFWVKQTESLPFDIIDSFFGEDLLPEEVNLDNLAEELNKVLLPEISFTGQHLDSVDDIKTYIKPIIDQHINHLYEFQDDQNRIIKIKAQMLYVIDHLWRNHLGTMKRLQEGMGIRQYQQEDPVELFEKEGYELFESLFSEIKYDIAVRITSMIKQTGKQQEEEAKA